MTTWRGAVMAVVAIALVGCGAPTPPPSSIVTPTSGVSNTPARTDTPTTTTAGPQATPVPSMAAIARKPACSLLSKQEVGSALGLEIVASTPADEGGAATNGWLEECAYLPQEVTELEPLLLTLGIGGDYPEQFEALSASADVTEVPNLGDGAIFQTMQLWGIEGDVGALFVRVGNAVMSLSLGIAAIHADGSLFPAIAGSDGQRSALTSLAVLALPRLTAPAAATAKVCELMSVEEATSLVGLPLLRATDVDDGDDWGPACHYSGGDGVDELYVAVDNRPTAPAHFDECALSSEPIAGLGEAAYYNHYCDVKPGPRFFNVALLARIGGVVVTIGEGGELDPADARQVIVAVARQIVGRLALSPGPSTSPVTPAPTTTPPATPSAAPGTAGFEHPCTLVTDDEVWTAIGAPVTSHTELAAGPGDAESRCLFLNDDLGVQPLELTLDKGANYVAQFNQWRASGGFTDVAGLGDAALSDQYEDLADQPLVNLYVLVGDIVVTMRMGGIGRSADGSLIAPGDPEEQLFVLSELAQTVIDRLLFPPPG